VQGKAGLLNGWSRGKSFGFSLRYNTMPKTPTREETELLMERDGHAHITLIEGESEVYIVRDSVWKKAGMEPYGGCLCIGTLIISRLTFPVHTGSHNASEMFEARL
jgi:hypothetical protein